MKKISLLAFIYLMSTFVSCDDSPLQVCASCTEQNSGAVADDYCANPVSVDAYIKTLENTSGQDWHCTKH